MSESCTGDARSVEEREEEIIARILEVKDRGRGRAGGVGDVGRMSDVLGERTLNNGMAHQNIPSAAQTAIPFAIPSVNLSAAQTAAPLDNRSLLEEVMKLVPDVNMDKYVRFDRLKDSSGNIQNPPPMYLAIIEQEMLYPKDYENRALDRLVLIIEKTVDKPDLVHLHRTLAKLFKASFRNRYSEEYDRWIALLIVRLISMGAEESSALGYFQGIIERLGDVSGAYRDRAVILSDYITNKEISHVSDESRHFYSHIAQRPGVEEEETELEEEESSDVFITTLAEYVSIITEIGFRDKSNRKKISTLEQLYRIAPQEPLERLKKNLLVIAQVLSDFQTEKTQNLITYLVSFGDLSYELLKVVYQRQKYSFYMRSTAVLCTIAAIDEIETPVVRKIAAYLRRAELSQEDRDLKIHFLLQQADKRARNSG